MRSSPWGCRVSVEGCLPGIRSAARSVNAAPCPKRLPRPDRGLHLGLFQTSPQNMPRIVCKWPWRPPACTFWGLPPALSAKSKSKCSVLCTPHSCGTDLLGHKVAETFRGHHDVDSPQQLLTTPEGAAAGKAWPSSCQTRPRGSQRPSCPLRGSCLTNFKLRN